MRQPLWEWGARQAFTSPCSFLLAFPQMMNTSFLGTRESQVKYNRRLVSRRDRIGGGWRFHNKLMPFKKGIRDLIHIWTTKSPMDIPSHYVVYSSLSICVGMGLNMPVTPIEPHQQLRLYQNPFTNFGNDILGPKLIMGTDTSEIWCDRNRRMRRLLIILQKCKWHEKQLTKDLQ